MSALNSSALNDGPPFGPVVNGTMVIVFWEYRPSNVAAYLFLALFALATLAHLVYFAWLRAWTFIPFILGGIAQIFGYYNRALAHASPTTLDPWLLQNMLLLISPPLLAATLYMAFHRVESALLHGTYKPSSNGKPKRNCCARCCLSLCCTCSPTRLYILADVASIFTQLIGTVLPASGTAEGQRLAKIVVLVGLVVQLIALGAFLFFGVGRLHVRLKRDPARSRAILADPGVNWLGYLVVMEVAAVMMVVRSIVRAVEYVGGDGSYVMRYEWVIYVFDGVAMLEVMVGFLVLYPARLVREVRRLEELVKGEECVELRGGGLRESQGSQQGTQAFQWPQGHRRELDV